MIQLSLKLDKRESHSKLWQISYMSQDRPFPDGNAGGDIIVTSTRKLVANIHYIKLESS